MEDRRVFERVPAAINVAYRVYGGKSKFKTISKDISGGGIRLSLNEKLDEGTILELEIGLPDTNRSIPALGKVAWTVEFVVRGDSVMKYYDTGIEFIRISVVCLGKIYRHFRQQALLTSPV